MERFLRVTAHFCAIVAGLGFGSGIYKWIDVADLVLGLFATLITWVAVYGIHRKIWLE